MRTSTATIVGLTLLLCLGLSSSHSFGGKLGGGGYSPVYTSYVPYPVAQPVPHGWKGGLGGLGGLGGFGGGGFGGYGGGYSGSYASAYSSAGAFSGGFGGGGYGGGIWKRR
ncbi:keratin, type II cytoskeletal 2 epidermal [Drosophila persimilis]|uniref:keratin, type II cytoskeletal 2 epidermal n=1 Tax=Drosophila persimilis TaxID=7234 RepID=UPI000F08E5AE|nr:keratin, type II cytoskeletal 2 epidermal [Drosophila persimilis]